MVVRIPDWEVVYLPKHLNLDVYLVRDPIRVSHYSNNYHRTKDAIAAILGQISQQMIFYKTTEVRLMSKTLERLVRNYPEIIDWAIRNIIIERDVSYTPGHASMTYRFTERPYKEWRRYYIHDRALIEKLRGTRIDKVSVKKHQELFQYLQEIELDKDKARKVIDSLEGNEKRYTRLAAVDGFDSLRFSVDSTVCRLHTSITSLKREVRSCLSWKGKELVNVDLKNSQPFFSLALFEEKKLVSLGFPHLLESYNSSINYHMFRRYAQICRTYDDIELYRKLVCDGMLYDELGRELGIERKKAKKLIFDIFFSPPGWDLPNKHLFLEKFPGVWKMFEFLNTGYTKTKKQGRKPGEQSSALALILQRIESIVFLDHIVPRILKELPGVPIWTIHDSILTPKRDCEEIAYIMRDECYKIIGHAPTVDFE